MSTTAFARMEWEAQQDEQYREDVRRENEALARLLEVAKRERIDAGEECPVCGNRDPELLIEDAPCGVPIFKCLRTGCYRSWFDVRNRRGDAQCDWQCDDERDAS